jgi:DNA-binding NarL/FixJ family response regulator
VVAVIDDQPITRSGLERLVAEQPRFTVAASVPAVDQLDAAGPPGGYDVAILALPPRARGVATDTIVSVAKIAHPMVVSTWDTPGALSNAVRAGARGCVTRHSDQDEILTALATVAAGGFYLSAALVDQFQAELGRAPREAAVGLAPREIETVRWIALGFTQSQIATRMGLSQATVNTYAKRIRSKLHVTNKAELTRIAIQLGYLADDRQHSAA